MKSSSEIHAELETFFTHPTKDFPAEALERCRDYFQNKRKNDGNICSNIAGEFVLLNQPAEAIKWFNLAIDGGYDIARWWLAEFLIKDTPAKNEEEAIRLYIESYPHWRDERDERDVRNRLSNLQDTHVSAAIGLLQIAQRDYATANTVSEQRRLKDQIDFIENHYPNSIDLKPFIEAADIAPSKDPLLDLGHQNYKPTLNLSLDEFKKRKASPKEIDNKENAGPRQQSEFFKRPKESLPKPRRFTFSDREISNATGKPYTRKKS